MSIGERSREQRVPKRRSGAYANFVLLSPWEECSKCKVPIIESYTRTTKEVVKVAAQSNVTLVDINRICAHIGKYAKLRFFLNDVLPYNTHFKNVLDYFSDLLPTLLRY